MWGSATLAIVVSSPCMMFANILDSVTQPRLATGPRADAIPGLDEGAIRIPPWAKNRHIMIGLTTPKAEVRRVHGCRALPPSSFGGCAAGNVLPLGCRPRSVVLSRRAA